MRRARRPAALSFRLKGVNTPAAEQLNELLRLAAAARQHAYAPYSGYAVGSAVLTKDGKVYTGCNVENVSYGLTVCAERNAIAAAVQGGMQCGELLAVAIVAGPFTEGSAHDTRATLPCGSCRQVLAEFGAPDTVVICTSAADNAQLGVGLAPSRYSLAELLPHPFGAS